MVDQIESNLIDIPVYFTAVDGRYSAYRTEFEYLVYPRSWRDDVLSEFTSTVINIWGHGFEKPGKGQSWYTIKKHPERAEYIWKEDRYSHFICEIYLKGSAFYHPNLLLMSDKLTSDFKKRYSYRPRFPTYREKALEALSA